MCIEDSSLHRIRSPRSLHVYAQLCLAPRELFSNEVQLAAILLNMNPFFFFLFFLSGQKYTDMKIQG